MDRKEKSWIKELDQPSQVTSVDSVGFLDRFIGIGNASEKHLLLPPKKQLNKNKTQGQNQPKIISGTVKTSAHRSVVDVDDTSWIEARKKRFPKRDTNPDENTVQCSTGEITAPSATSDQSQSVNIIKYSKRNITKPDSLKVKKSLFEKLMELD